MVPAVRVSRAMVPGWKSALFVMRHGAEDSRVHTSDARADRQEAL